MRGRKMEIADLIKRYLEVFLSWPVIILIIFVIFKNEISDFLKRLVKGEALGMRLEATRPSEQQKEAKEALPAKTKSEIEAYIRDNPELVSTEYIRLWNGYIFERTFNFIFGTQIDLLEHLLDKGDEGEKYINLAGFYNEHNKRLGKQSIQMADYLGYLKASSFIKYEREGSEFNVTITPYGADFLSYIKTYYSLVYKIKAF